MATVVVTGGAGFIGANLVRRIAESQPEAHIIVVDDCRTGRFGNLVDTWPWDDAPFAGQFIAAPVGELDWERLLTAHRPHTVFHLASITDTTVSDEQVMIRDNAHAFDRLLAAVRATRTRLVWASSAATYGRDAGGATDAKRPFVLEDAGRPANIYGFSKWLMENAHRAAAAEDPGLHIVGLRYFNVFGPGEACKGKMASMVYQLAQQCLRGERPRIFYDGTQARDQVYVRDVVDATLAAASATARSGIYNVGSGEATSFNEIVRLLGEALDSPAEPEYFENPYAFYQDFTCADLTATADGLGWRPRHKPADAIVQYARWLAQQRGLVTV